MLNTQNKIFALAIFATAIGAPSTARADSYKKLVNQSTGQALEIAASDAASKPLGQSVYAGKIGQNWNIRTGDGDAYSLVSADGDQAITAQGKTGVAAQPYTGEVEQLWQIVPLGDGWNAIRLKSNERDERVSLEATPDGIALKPFTGASAQKWKFTVVKSDVYIGGTHPLKYLADPANAKDWSYVAANADGLYTSNVGLHLRSVKGDYFSTDPHNYDDFLQLMKSIGARMKHENLFYETDATLTRNPKWDGKVITTAMDAGWNVSNVALWDTGGIRFGAKYGYPRNYFAYLRTGWPARPIHIGTGTWFLGGDFGDRKYLNHDFAENALIQDTMLAQNAGSATEGPGTFSPPEFMAGDKNLDSLTRWVQHNLPAVPTQSNISPGDLAPLGFMRQVQRIVKHAEDAGTSPDIWAVTYYGPISSLNLGPETDSYTYMGVAKWLIQHEQDPQKYPAKDWPYLRDEFNDLAQWKNTAGATTDKGQIVLDGASEPRTREIAWSPDFQIHLSSIVLKSGSAGVVFRDQGNGNFYCWEFGDKTLTCEKYINGVPTIIKANISTAIARGEATPNIIIEVVGSKIRTYVNRMLVDTTDDATFTTPGAVGFQTAKGSQVSWGRITVY